MKNLITLLVVLMPLTVSSVHTCDNPCWLIHIGPQGTTNKEKVTWIAMHGVEAYKSQRPLWMEKEQTRLGEVSSVD